MEVYKSYLKAKYSEMPHYGKWPHLSTEKYINMSVIEKGRHSMDDSKALTYGKIDSVKRKSDIAFKDIARPTRGGVMPKFVLVEGAPGVGKTTFAWEACRKWAEGEILEDFDLVILVRLRDRSVRSAKCLGDLIQYQRDAKIQSEIVREVTKSGGKGVLLLFEGYDELPASLQQDGSLFRNIIQNGCEFDEGTVVVTSRHWASEPFLFPYSNPSARAVSQHIEILGFTTRNIEDYISSMLCDELLRDMKEYLELCPHIHSMMYIPLNCAIVLEVYKTSKKHNTLIPKTTTELYSSLIRSLLLRYICDLPEYQDKVFRIDLKSLPACVRNHFSIITELAYEAIFDRNQQIIFSEDDVPSDFNSLGLMQSAMELYVDVGATTSYNFLHLTIQEFLAAHHISTLPVQQQVEFFNRAHAAEMVITFLAGLSSSSFEKFLTDYSHTPHMITPHLNIHLSFEARLQPTSAFVLTEALHDPFTSYMLGYIISKSSIFWNFSMDGNKDVINFFIRGILSSGNTISEATIALNVEMDRRRNTLAGLSCAAITIDTLVVSNVSEWGLQSDIGLFFRNLADGDPLIIKHLHLKSLSLDHMNVNDFKLYLEGNSVLKRLTLEECPISAADDRALLSQGLQACKCLEVLNISFHQQGAMLNLTGNKSIKLLEVGVCSCQQIHGLFTAMCGKNVIEELIVKKIPGVFYNQSLVNFLGRAMVHELVNKMVIMSTELKSLNLSIVLPSDDFNVICDALSANSALQKLTISTCNMWPCEGVANMLRLNKSLKELTILDISLISDSKAFEELGSNRSLEKFCMKNGPNGIEIIQAFALVIKQNTTLRELEVSAHDHQHISILSNALKHNKTLAKMTINAELNLDDAIVTEDERLTIQTYK
jgi:hypothetical protein